MVQPESAAAVKFWHADAGTLYKEIVGEKLQFWNWKDKVWRDGDQSDVMTWDDRKWAGECDQISAEQVEQLAPGASA